MPVGRKRWLIALGVAGALEVWGVTHTGSDDTLSELTRWAFATDTSTGRILFGVAWAGFAGWYMVHILGGSKRDA